MWTFKSLCGNLWKGHPKSQMLSFCIYYIDVLIFLSTTELQQCDFSVQVIASLLPKIFTCATALSLGLLWEFINLTSFCISKYFLKNMWDILNKLLNVLAYFHAFVLHFEQYISYINFDLASSRSYKFGKLELGLM